MRPRQSGGGTANDPVDFTLSDTEPVLSDAPVTISKDKAKPFQSSGSDIVELVNGKRVRPTKEVKDVGGPSTSQLVPDLPAAKRSRPDPPVSIAPAASTSTAPVKKMTTARKSTQHISSAHRLRWEATQATIAAAAAEQNEDISHEEAMRQAAAERRRSQSARKPSHSPTKVNAEPGPGPSSNAQSSQRNIKHRALEDTNKAGDAQEAVEASSPMMVHSESSPDPISVPTILQVKKVQPETDSLVPISAPVSSSGRVKPSPFQTSDTPGSWGFAIPMSVPPSSRPRSHTPKSIHADSTPEAGPSNSQKLPVKPNPTSKPQPQIHAEAPVQSQSSKPMRKGPTWKTAESPPPAPPKELSVDPLPSQPIDMDELDMESSFNTAEASLELQSLPVSHDIDMDMAPEETFAFDRSSSLSALPDLPSQLSDVELDNDTPAVVKESLKTGIEATSSTVIFEPTRTSGETDLQPTVGQQPDTTIDGTEVIGSGASVEGVVGTASSSVIEADRVGTGRGGFSVAGAASAAARARWAKFRAAKEAAGESIDDIKEGETPLSFDAEIDLLLPSSAELKEPEEPTSFNADIDLLLPSSNIVDDDIAMDGQPSGDLADPDATLLDLIQTDKTNGVDHDLALEIDDLTASLPEEMEQIDLTRSRESSSGGSFEEIPEEIARSQIVFSRPTATQSSRRSGPSQPAVDEETPDADERRVLRSIVDSIAQDDSALVEAGSSRPRRLKLRNQERAKSSSSSSSGSPSKRASNRLASRTLTPVYSFSKVSHSPIKWRQIVEMDGESEVEDLLRAPSRAESSGSGSSSMTIDGVERTLTATFIIPIVDSPPPPERRSRAIREFDTQLIDEWNKLSPGLTHNPALHRLIFESYIERCVDNEPEIKVYNDVDYESIPPNFEFQYSNDMLYNEDVPEPELGLGCDCEGGCSVTSKTCSCLKRQRLYNSDINEDFAYDDDGTLKQPVPIWECGPNCGCPPECMNRIVQRGRTNAALVDLFKTKKKGWGVRARNFIPKGTFLGIYSGEVIPEAESERRGAIYEKAGRTYLFDCDGFHITNPPKGLEEVDPRLAVLARDSARRAALAAADENEPGAYNAYSIDAFHFGNFTRYFNHSCSPNLQIVQAYVNDYHPERPLLVIFALYDVEAGEELCISYKGLPEEEEVVPDKTKKGGKRRKIKKPKTTAAVHVSKKKGDFKEKDACFCGAKNCDGVMFNRSLG